jgi:hypothetical protein
MSEEEADKAGVEQEKRRGYYRTYIDKGNMSPPAEGSDWFHLWSVNLENGVAGQSLDAPEQVGFIVPELEGDRVGVTTLWAWPSALQGVTGRDFERAAALIRGGTWRENLRASDWVGKPVAEALNLDLDEKKDRSRVKRIVGSWIAAGSLVVVEGRDDRRKPVRFVEVAREAQ